MRTVALLEPDTVDLMCRLAVFDGPFTRELASGVARRVDRVERDLDRLVRTAMIQREDDAGHYRLLVPARQFAWGRLDHEAQTEVSWSHARLLLARAEAAEPMMRSAHEAAAVASLRFEFADHRSAVLWFIDHDAIEEAARHVNALFVFCLFQPRPEGHRWVRMVADRLQGDEPLAAELIGAAAIGAWFEGDTAGAIETAQRAIDLADKTGGSDWWARHALVDALGYAGDLAAITPHFLAFVSASQSSSDPFRQIYGLGLQAVSMAMFGRFEHGVRFAEQAIAMARDLGNPSCMHWGFTPSGVSSQGSIRSAHAKRSSRRCGRRRPLAAGSASVTACRSGWRSSGARASTSSPSSARSTCSS